LAQVLHLKTSLGSPFCSSGRHIFVFADCCRAMDDEEENEAEWMQMLEGVCAQEQAADEEAAPEEEVGIEANEEGDELAGLDVAEAEAEAEEEVFEEAATQETPAEEVQETADAVMDGVAGELNGSQVLDEGMLEDSAHEAEGETEVEGGMQAAQQPLTGFIEIEDDGEEEGYDDYGEEQEEEVGEAQETEQADDAELADLEEAALAQAEGAASDSQAGAEFRDALAELPEESPMKPTAREQGAPSATKAAGGSAGQGAAKPTGAEVRLAGPATAATSSSAARRPMQVFPRPPATRPAAHLLRPGKGVGTAKGTGPVRPPAASWTPMSGSGANTLRKGSSKGIPGVVAPWGTPGVKGTAPGLKGASPAGLKGHSLTAIGSRPLMKGGKLLAKGAAKGKVADSGKAVAPWNSHNRAVQSPSVQPPRQSASIGSSNNRAVQSPSVADSGKQPSRHPASTGRWKPETNIKGVGKEKVDGSGKATAPWNRNVKNSGSADGGTRNPAPAAPTSGKRPTAPAAATSNKATAASAATAKRQKANGNSEAVGKSEAEVASKPASMAEKIKASIKSEAVVASKPASVAKKIKASIKAASMKESDKAEGKVKQSSPASVVQKVAATVAAAGKRKGSEAAADSKGPAKKPKVLQVAAVDAEGRQYDLEHVVVNFANVGAYFAIKVLNNMHDGKFDWEGVRRCIRHLTKEVGLKVVGVIYEQFKAPDNGSHQKRLMPDDIRNMCEAIQETPRIQGQNHSSADDEMTIKCAYRRNCRFMDNDNYRDWKTQLRDDKCRLWLTSNQNMLQMRYYFDTSLGTFDTLDGNIPPGMLAPVRGKEPARIDKRQLWTASRY